MRRTLMVFFAFILVTVCGSWGFLVHRTVNQLAIYELPKNLQRFFHSNRTYLVKESVRPDERRQKDLLEAAKHFIDLEAYGDSAAWKMSWSWKEATATFSSDTLLKYGYVPYVVMAVKERLTEAFRLKNKDSILFYAADLGHYVGDMHVPLHTTLNYNGQLTGQVGLHSLWESMIPELELKNYDLSSRHKATYLREPEQQVWAAVRHAFDLTKNVFALEREVTQAFTPAQKYRTQMRRGKEVKSYTSDFARAYSKRLGNTVNEQLISSVNLLADLWITSWIDAGRPDLSALLVQPYRGQVKRQLKLEVKLFRKNELHRQGMLLSQKDQAGEAE
ncbi:MAG: zinc dependent phospholipase C family protein [Chitinophagaceae bacterium]